MYEVNEKRYILFMGWQLKEHEHWRGDIGRIELIDNDKMKVTSEKPFLGIDQEDKLSLSYPWVMFQGKEFIKCGMVHRFLGIVQMVK